MAHQSDLIAQDIHEYLKQHEQKELLRFLTCGSVDDGKSTLIGRLLHDSKMIYEDQLAAIEQDSKKSGTTGEKIDLALLVDGLQAEREQGITIDVAYRYFSTNKRKFIIADTPGHEQYTRNMATGASTCDLAVILIDARYGVMTQTRRHSYIAHLLGLKHVVVAVNKMDLVDFSEERFEQIKADYLAFREQLNLPNTHFVPMSALDGDNVVTLSERSPWYQGPTLMELLENIEISRDRDTAHFRLPVQYVNRPNLDFRGFAGTIASGIVRPGDKVVAMPSGLSSTVERIVTFEGDLDHAFPAQAVTLTLADEIDVSRGDMLVGEHETPLVSQAFKAKVVWMHDDAMVPGRQYDFKVGTQSATGSISQLHRQIDVNTLESHLADQLPLNGIGDVTLQLNKPVVVDPYGVNPYTGAFIIIDRLTNITVGAGMIDDVAEVHDAHPVTEAERNARYRQKPVSLVLAVDNAAEQAVELERALFDLGHACVIVRPEDALQVAPYVEAAGLIAIIAGNTEAPFGFKVDDASPKAVIRLLREHDVLED
ncbi:sulfate adenylyltransferase subunit CysN [Saccharospirillum salsuginis]|uniref:Sulfate adenylyltransferase subunit 1 n=1 Tax=Saccharospirillum salsuginis TaxID=418750 RepID=A0A918KNY7_9GAMM|nr:sulfate adenylyltransferase subunit CysN [Saccharospirillum salsuginis]GGX70362.1 bifunctional enzyme CysN/CysC [Saccharospirillum salsuginis]